MREYIMPQMEITSFDGESVVVEASAGYDSYNSWAEANGATGESTKNLTLTSDFTEIPTFMNE